MTPEEAIAELQRAPLYFDPRTASAYILSGGSCEYCGRELIKERLGYACAQIDHILPKGKHPFEITDRKENFALSCSLCNGIKRDTCLLQTGEDPLAMLTSQRPVLIQRGHLLIEGRLKEENEKWELVKLIYSGLSGAAAPQQQLQADGPAFGGSAA